MARLSARHKVDSSLQDMGVEEFKKPRIQEFKNSRRINDLAPTFAAYNSRLLAS
jgi:hypothetical protein